MAASPQNTIAGPAFITDSTGAVWSISSPGAKDAQICRNGVIDTTTGHVTLMFYAGDVLYHQNLVGEWYAWRNGWVYVPDLSAAIAGGAPLPAPVPAPSPVPAPTPGPTPGGPPPQAVAAGYTNWAMLDDFTSDTFGVNWFAYNRDGGAQLTTGTTSTSQAYIDTTGPGRLVVQTDLSGFGSGLQSMNGPDPLVSEPGSIIPAGSRLFRYGYFEARMRFDQHGYAGQGAWPAWWSGSILTSNPHSEIDFMEAQPAQEFAGVRGSPASLTSTVHEWRQGGNDTNGATGIIPPSGFDWAGFNTYGCLWTPTSITFYVNDVLAVMPNAQNPVAIGNGTAFPSAAINPVVLILGTGRDWPVEFDFVRVWQ